MRTMLGVAIFAAVLAGPGALARPIGSGDLVSLAESLDPLQERFNADVGKRQVVALLSPT